MNFLVTCILLGRLLKGWQQDWDNIDHSRLSRCLTRTYITSGLCSHNDHKISAYSQNTLHYAVIYNKEEKLYECRCDLLASLLTKATSA
jgi:hypothetical protein